MGRPIQPDVTKVKLPIAGTTSDPIEKLFSPIKKPTLLPTPQVQQPQNILPQQDVLSPRQGANALPEPEREIGLFEWARETIPGMREIDERIRTSTEEARGRAGLPSKSPEVSKMGVATEERGKPSLAQRIQENINLPADFKAELLEKFFPGESSKTGFTPYKTEEERTQGIEKLTDIGKVLFDPTDPLSNVEGPAKAVGAVSRAGGLIPGIPKKAKEAADELLSMMKTGEGTAGAGLDPSLFRKLGSNLYSGDIAQVAVKEGIQNAVDAVKARGTGTIGVEIDQSKDMITVSDDGIGMSPETAANQFLDVGGSLKHEGAAGGYGLAKVGLLLNAKRFYLNTTAETPKGLMRTIIEGSGEDWINGKLKYSSELVDPTAPHAKTGTTLEIELDREQVDPDWDSARKWLEKYNATNRLEGVTLNAAMNSPYSGKREVLKKPVQDLGTPVETVEFPNATLEVYVGSKMTKYGQINANVLNQGLYQFTKDMYLQEAGEIPQDLIFNIKSKVKPDQPDYPFTTSREEVKGEINTYIQNYVKGIETKLAAKKIDTVRDALLNPFRISGTDMGVFATSPKVSRELATLIAGRDYAKETNELIKGVSQEIFHAIAQRYPEIENFNYGGFGLGPDYLGINIQVRRIMEKAASKGIKVGEIPDRNTILYNPFTTMKEAPGRVWDIFYAGNPENMAEFLGQNTWDTMVHEVVHQLASGHNEKFAGVFTRVLHTVTPRANEHINELIESWSKALYEGLEDDYNKLWKEWDKPGEVPDIFKGFGGHTSTKNVPRTSKRSNPRTP